ncbi:MAG: hypothetical protein ACK5NF_01415 [Bacilli bacterium]
METTQKLSIIFLIINNITLFLFVSKIMSPTIFRVGVSAKNISKQLYNLYYFENIVIGMYGNLCLLLIFLEAISFKYYDVFKEEVVASIPIFSIYYIFYRVRREALIHQNDNKD